MKRIEDIEKLELDDLMQIADDESVKAPARLDLVPEAMACVADMNLHAVHSGRGRLAWTMAGVAAAAYLAVAVMLHPAAPKDTFDDPYLAYEELERTFALIADKMDKGVGLASSAEPVFYKTTDVMNKINNR